MSSEFRDGNAAQTAPVYTVYTVPGGHGGNSDYGIHQSNPHAPPPKYEDVISGISTGTAMPSQPAGTYHAHAEPAGVIFIAPVHKPTGIQRSIGIIFLVLFLIAFISILCKILSVSFSF